MALRFKPCDCDAPDFVREHRSGWVRWALPHVRHWSCRSCGQHFLASKGVVAAHGAPGRSMADARLPTPSPR